MAEKTLPPNEGAEGDLFVARDRELNPVEKKVLVADLDELHEKFRAGKRREVGSTAATSQKVVETLSSDMFSLSEVREVLGAKNILLLDATEKAYGKSEIRAHLGEEKFNELKTTLDKLTVSRADVEFAKANGEKLAVFLPFSMLESDRNLQAQFKKAERTEKTTRWDWESDDLKEEEFLREVSREIVIGFLNLDVPDSRGEDNLGQTEALLKYNEKAKKAGATTDAELVSMRAEFDEKSAGIIWIGNRRKKNKAIHALSVNEQLRSSPASVKQALDLQFATTGDRLLPDYGVCTQACDSNGGSVYLFDFDARGVDVGRWLPEYESDWLSVPSLRRLVTI